MDEFKDLIDKMRATPELVDFTQLRLLCEHVFGAPRVKGAAHAVFRLPDKKDPLLCIQSEGGRARAYQVYRVLEALAKARRRKK